MRTEQTTLDFLYRILYNIQTLKASIKLLIYLIDAFMHGQMAESAEGGRLLSDYTV